jgi:hypothetical protein
MATGPSEPAASDSTGRRGVPGYPGIGSKVCGRGRERVQLGLQGGGEDGEVGHPVRVGDDGHGEGVGVGQGDEGDGDRFASARMPTERARLCAMTARASQAPLAMNLPEGR